MTEPLRIAEHPHSLAHNPSDGRFLVDGRWQDDRPEDVSKIAAIWVGNIAAADILEAIHQGKIEVVLGTPYGSLGLQPTVRRVWQPIEEGASDA